VADPVRARARRRAGHDSVTDGRSVTHRHPDAGTDHPGPDADSHTHADVYPQPNAHGDAYSNAYRFANADGDSDRVCHAYFDSYGYSYLYAHSNGNGYSNSNSYS